MRLVGLVLVVAGGLNLILVDAVLPVGVYRETWVALAGIPAWPLGDFVAIGVGAAIAWFV